MNHKQIIITLMSLCAATISFFSFAPAREKGGDSEKKHGLSFHKVDSVQSIVAFKEVYKVLMSPRCMNCHPSGDAPLQGDDSHPHEMGVTRGKDGKGIYAVKCANCHQAENSPGLHAPPGNPNWHLPPADMKMVFEGKSPSELAKQLLDPAQNGGKTKEELLKHITSDGLVLGGWNPGEGRTLPPLSHKQFSDAFKTWLQNGAVTNIE